MNPTHLALRLANTMVSANRLSILIYHQVLEEPDPMRPGATDAQSFLWQMRLLRRHFRPLSLDRASRLLREGALPARSVCVTFDDGYRDNLDVATPILRQFDIPATVFIATAFCEGRNMWNDRLIDLVGDTSLASIKLDALELDSQALDDTPARLALVDKLLSGLKYRDYHEREALVNALYRDNGVQEAGPKMLSHKEIIRLSRSGVSVGAHTVDHPILKSLAPTEQRLQIESSKQALENLTGQAVTSFAYPNGKPGKDYDDLSVQMVGEAGFEQAVTTNWGVSTPSTNPLKLHRFTPWDTSSTRFHLRLLRNIIES